ncbi:bifunctional sugar phosphate isomerase/epimerase/4-hydroxyphenylpyruvate dioxygenase family protein [Pseudonocardia sp. H11422]|uniref:bifunctional sugar phosphate isomerase/epimerase/4-hydroxyphenylpyruvate dioxygenase family protein n=1 Tax=Pseudonocardia sp. H11422 TaxID=2835866 RepID=UPI001BDCD73E|nr:sugar phosphate isomerase/epimerase and 4-hydroxyphenylpyruvate domain-containing protein [Pseudonocardia sp. H11422]
MSLSARSAVPVPHRDSRATGLRTAVATVCLSGTLEDKLAAAAAAGFDGVEIFEPDLVAAPWSPVQVRRRCADLGLSIDLYQPFRDFDAVAPEVLAANLRRAERKFDVMEQLGTDLVLVCSSVSPHAVDDDHLAAEQLHTLAARAGERGLRVCYEALAWGRFVNTYERSWEIVRRADHPALGLCVDSFHILSRGSDPAGIRDIPGEKLFFLQLADAPHLDMDVLQWSRHHRLFPGQGTFDLPAFLGHVLAAGYTGPLSLEVFNDVFRQADPERAAVDALRSLLALQESTLGHLSIEGRDRAGPTVLPPAQDLGGYAFTEIALDEDSGPQVARTLAALGFAHTGQHRSKPVQLWQQGGARVLLNASGGEPGAAVTALGIETADPSASARRAEALLAPVLARTRGPAEADLSAVVAPDGTSVFFCRTGAGDTTSWLSDFTSSDVPDGGTGITGVDHVALTQPFDHFDEAALFYRSVLGLQTQHSSEIAAPFGLVRNRAVADPARTVRICLSVSVLRRGEWGPGVTDPQHLAFASDDVVAVARAARASGAPLLAIPDNYYDDLDARLAPPPDLLAALREHGVLYDRDANGAFLHFYTAVLGSRVFFEVVQRVDGYNGYGEVNAPVRMAAHRRRRMSRTGAPGAAVRE